MPLRTWHQGAISGVAGENPAFEPATRLAKRWVGAHLLSPHLREEAVELILAHCFATGSSSSSSSNGSSNGVASSTGTAAAVAAAPASRLSGLLRFLQLLAEHPWRVQPLIVDPNSELSAAQRDAIVRQHSAAREAGAAPSLCIATPRDPSGSAWTSAARPSSQVLHRIAVLAQRSAAALEALLLGSACETAAAAEGAAGKTAAAVFSRDLGEYDVLLRLRSDALPNAANDLRIGSVGSRSSSSSGSSGRQQLGPALQAANEQLAAATAAATAAPSSKHSRAILKGIPQSEYVCFWVGVKIARGRRLPVVCIQHRQHLPTCLPTTDPSTSLLLCSSCRHPDHPGAPCGAAGAAGGL
jgi:U3 small nucleolar RNA-associated protein 22